MTGLSSPFTPTIDPAIWQLRPDFAALSIIVRGGRNAPSAGNDDWRPTAPPPWAQPHLEAWREAYRAFGSKPQRTPCSAEALRWRVERDGSLPRINAVVDLYNKVSVEFAVPVGGENRAAYVGRPRLVRANGDEPFETARDGEPWIETAARGEVVWRDNAGVTCRRWNWRQSTRTRLAIDTTEMWFVLERLEPMPLANLKEAGECLMHGLRQLAPDAEMSTTLISPGTVEREIRKGKPRMDVS
jgi:DNA/RNA-binding domain of Phe-tRNA-synthetase-like protein